MPNESDQPSTHAPKRRMPVSDLIRYLQTLYVQLSSHLWNQRLQGPRGGDNSGVEIGNSLQGHLEQTAAEAVAEPRLAADAANASADPGNVRAASKGGVSQAVFDALAKHFRRRKAQPHIQPHLAEKMQSTTMDHINKAVLMAREGNIQSAKLHAGLAENAMRTAGDYMAEEEFKVFKRDVEEKLRAIES